MITVQFNFKKGNISLCSYRTSCMSCIFRCNLKTIVEGRKMSLGGSQEALGIADRSLSTPQRQQDGLEILLRFNVFDIIKCVQMFTT